ncbi:MAG TPA: LacI family DNA-binding transcriptional regulator [Rariglobus sp.]
MEPKRVTQQDIAKAAGVHRTTVCLALKNYPRIPAETRERIVRIAEELGYSPDPMLSALASYRTRLRPQSFHGTLVWLVNSANGYAWDAFPHYRDYHQGATSQARQNGYNLETLDLNAPLMSPDRIASILRARNVQGVLLCPQPQANMVMQFPWEQISAVTFGYTLAEPRIHTVTAAHHRHTVHCIRELKRRGYRRIGFAFSKEHDLRTDHNFLSGYLSEEIGYDHLALPIPAFLESYRRSSEKIDEWLKHYRPDAIVTGEYQALDRLRLLGWKIPRDLGVACPTLPTGKTRLAGIVEDSVHIGSVAVNLLVSAIQRGEKGVPSQPQRILVEGLWNEGSSLRSPAKTTRAPKG